MKIFKENLYEQLIEDLSLYLKLTSSNVSVEYYLKSLQDTQRNLWKTLQSSAVSVDYSEFKTQLCYLFRYLHLYWEQIYSGLTEIDEIRKDNLFGKTDKNIRIGLFFCGPAPEIIGITNYLEERNLLDNKRSIEIDMYDQYINQWRLVRNNFIINSPRLKKLTELGFNFNTQKLDFTSSITLVNSSKYSICCFQNCINEFWDRTNPLIVSNFRKVASEIEIGGYIILTDRNFLESSAKEIIETLLKQNFNLLYSSYGEIDCSKKSPIPEILSQNLFIGSDGLKASKYNRRFLYILQKDA
jgi:hypothetical protein